MNIEVWDATLGSISPDMKLPVAIPDARFYPRLWTLQRAPMAGGHSNAIAQG